MDLKSDLIPTLLGQAQFPSFSPDLDALQSCADEEALYEMLLQSMEREPFLLAKFVTRANSIAFGAPGEHFFAPRDCLSRVGLVEGLHTALDFYLEDALGPFIRKNRHCVATWKEARIAAQLSKHLRSQCVGDFRTGAAFLASALSYVGELFALGFVDSSDIVNMGLYAQARAEQADVFNISAIIMGKLQLPPSVTRNFRQIREVVAGAPGGEFHPNAAAILLSRALAQASQPMGVAVAQVSPDISERVVEGFGLSEKQVAHLVESSRQTRQRIE